MYSDLVRLQVDETVDCLVYKTSSAHRAHIDARVPDIFHIEALDAEREKNSAVGKVFDDHVFFALVVGCSADDIAVVGHVFYQQVIARIHDLVKRRVA